jgi:DNA-directed RNA polymerase specialized sigma24 family protein
VNAHPVVRFNFVDRDDAATPSGVTSMQADRDLRSLSLEQLADACTEDHRRTTTDAGAPNPCLELFRRAIKEKDEQAWAVVISQYRRIVLSWVGRNSLYYSTGEQAEFFAQDAFIRMWQHLTAEKYDQLNDLRSLMGYLKMCVNSALVDYMRRQDQPEEELAESLPQPDTAASFSQVDREQVWQLIAGLIHGDKEWLVVRGLFVWGFKPNELYTRYHTLFRDVKEVYTIRENVMNRLRRDRNLKEYFDMGA